MKRFNFYSFLLLVHILLIFITVFGSAFVIAIGEPVWLVAFLTIPLVNLLLIPITKKNIQFDPTHPILMILVSLMIGTVLRSFFIISPIQSDAKFLMLLGKPPEFLLIGIVALYLGFIFFVLGYSYPVKPISSWKKKKVFYREVSMKRYWPFAILITTISVYTAWVYFKKVGVDFSDVDAISQKRRVSLGDGKGYTIMAYYRMVMDLVEPLFYIVLIYMLIHKKSILSFMGMFTLAIGILNLIYPFVESSRTNTLYVLINTGLIIYYIKGGIKIKYLLQVGAACGLLLIIMTSLRNSKSAARAATPVSHNPLVIMVGSTNFLGVDKTSQIIAGVPDKLDYQFGYTYLLWIIAPIPSTLWKDKPEVSFGLEIGEKIYAKRDASSFGGGIPSGYIAELYLNFGWAGVIGGMFLLGIVFKLLYDFFVDMRETSTFSMLIYIMALVPLFLNLIGGDFSTQIVKVIKASASIYIIIKLMQKKDANSLTTL